MSPPFWGVPGAIYSPKSAFRGDGHCRAGGSISMAASLKWFLIQLILTPLDIYIYFQFLKRYGTQKSNCQIKSYGSQKFGMQRLVCHPNFHDISTVLTLILNHEQSFKWELNNLHNGIGFNPFRQPNQNQGFWAYPRSTSDQTWSKLLKNSEKLKFEVKL